MYTRVCVSIHVSVYLHNSLSHRHLGPGEGYIYVCIYVYISVYLYIYIHTYITGTSVPERAIHICIDVYICVYMYIFIHIYHRHLGPGEGEKADPDDQSVKEAPGIPHEPLEPVPARVDDELDQEEEDEGVLEIDEEIHQPGCLLVLRAVILVAGLVLRVVDTGVQLKLGGGRAEGSGDHDGDKRLHQVRLVKAGHARLPARNRVPPLPSPQRLGCRLRQNLDPLSHLRRVHART